MRCLPLISLVVASGCVTYLPSIASEEGPLVIKIDFAENAGTGGEGWNTVSGDLTSLSLVDASGHLSEITWVRDQPFTGSSSSNLDSSDLGQDWPGGVTGDHLFIQQGSSSETISFALTGLKEDTPYRLRLLARTMTPEGLGSYTNWTANGLPAYGMVFNSERHPDASSSGPLEWAIVMADGGRIQIEGRALERRPAAHLNGLILEEMSEAYKPETFWIPWTFAFDEIDAIVWVDHEAADRDSVNPDGSSNSPYPTIQQGVDHALGLAQTVGGVEVRVRSGIYRESVRIEGHTAGTPVVIRAEEAGRVIISGSEPFNTWTNVDDEIYEAPWPYRHGWQANPWPDNLSLDYPGFRYEMLFLDGAPYLQVFAARDIQDRTFYVDEEQGRIYLDPEGDRDPETALIECAVRPIEGALVLIQASENIALVGLRVQHASTLMFQEGAVSLKGSQRIRLENMEIVHNVGCGLEFNSHNGKRVRHLTLVDVEMNHNGTMGMTGSLDNLRVINGSCNLNNWRGSRYGVTGWSPCGFKLAFAERIWISGMEVIGNQAQGAWFDMDIRYALVENMVAWGNLKNGVDLEASFGPFILRDSLLAYNGDAGLTAYDNSFAVLENSVFYQNASEQIHFNGEIPAAFDQLPAGPSWWRRRQAARQVPSWYFLHGNVIGAEGRSMASSKLIRFSILDNRYMKDDKPVLERLQQTWFSDNNTFFHPYPETVPYAFSNLTGTAANYEEYRAQMGSDRSSTWHGISAPEDLPIVLKERAPHATHFTKIPLVDIPNVRFYDPSLRADAFGFRHSESIGLLYTALYPWIHLPVLGWTYAYQDLPEPPALFNTLLGWIHTDSSHFPFIWLHERASWAWVHLAPGTAERWLFIFGDDIGRWESF